MVDRVSTARSQIAAPPTTTSGSGLAARAGTGPASCPFSNGWKTTPISLARYTVMLARFRSAASRTGSGRRCRWRQKKAMTSVGYPALGDQNGVLTYGHFFPMTLSYDMGKHRLSTAMASRCGDAVPAEPHHHGGHACAPAGAGRRHGHRRAGEAGRARGGHPLPRGHCFLGRAAFARPANALGHRPPGGLAKVGVEAVVDLPGVGANLQ